MSARYFIDTNVFVYQLERLDVRKSAIAERLIRHGIDDGTGCISFQVVQECLNTALRKAEIPLTEADLRMYMEAVMMPLLSVRASLHLYHSSLDIYARYGFSFYDSLIVAAALEAGCTRLYMEDLQHGQQIGQLTVVDPFRE
jgi:predicted nucleic acid-binding protein